MPKRGRAVRGGSSSGRWKRGWRRERASSSPCPAAMGRVKIPPPEKSPRSARRAHSRRSLSRLGAQSKSPSARDGPRRKQARRPARSAPRAGIVRGLLAQPAGEEAQRDHAHREQRQGAGDLGDGRRNGKRRRGRGQGGEEETSFHRDKVMGSAVGSSCGAKCPSRLPTGKNETDPSMSCILLHVSGTWADDPKCKCCRRLERVALQVREGGEVASSQERVVSS